MKRVLALALAGCVLTATVFANKFDAASTYITTMAIKCTDGGSRVIFDENTVVGIDGIGISQEYYNLIYSSYYNQAYQYYSYYMGAGEDWLEQKIDEEGTTVADDIKRAVIQYLTEETVVCNMAKEYNIEINEEIKKQIEEARQQTIDSCGGKEGYEAALKEIRTSDEAYTKSLENSIVYEKCIEAITENGEILGVDIEAIKKEFSEKYMKVQHILISNEGQPSGEDGSATARTEEEMTSIVNEVLEKINAGEDFDSLIDAYNEDPGMSSGKFYVFTDGQMVEEFEKASKELKPGEYTKEAVKTDFGYHIIKKYETVAEGSEYESFKSSHLEEKIVEIVSARIDNAFVEINDEVLNPYLDAWNKSLQESV